MIQTVGREGTYKRGGHRDRTLASHSGGARRVEGEGGVVGGAAPGQQRFLFRRARLRGEMAGVKEGDERCVLGRVMSLSDMVLGFFEDGEGSPEGYRDGYGDAGEGSGDDERAESPEERRAFWESQHQLLQVALSRHGSLESRIRRDTEAALRQLRSETGACSCSRKAVRECRECLLRGVSERLRTAGYNSAICKSKWRSAGDIPKGEHTYIDVVDASNAKKGPVRVVVEPFFRAEFEVARASQDYSGLVRRLPEAFVGKPEKLRGVVKVVCAAAKKCMKDNKMHMPPWRKYKYMQAKWLSPSERVTLPQAPPAPPAPASPEGQRKLRASMLTFDLLDNFPGLRRTAVEVV
ncbi:hypothetical protein Taro_044350 [Colocasia esculenta]|uniref:Plant-specific domain TIGR01615 family protein n=1 Tax=Colocasia esculenta TaxID=4460 RepID=A0A843X2J2_COLES|nr:hypothetical protein [Colocasia esculenta]